MRTKKTSVIISLFLAAVICVTGCSSKSNDIEESDLVEIDLEEIDLEEIDLEEIDLEESNLEESDLEESDLEESDLEENDPGENSGDNNSGGNIPDESMLIGSWCTEYSKETVFTLNSDHTVTDDGEETKYWTLLDDGSLKIYLGSELKICDTSLLKEGKLIVKMNYGDWTLLKEDQGNADVGTTD